MSKQPKLREPIQPVIGAWADFVNYDPDGLCGEPTPRDEAFERLIFGSLVDLIPGRPPGT